MHDRNEVFEETDEQVAERPRGPGSGDERIVRDTLLPASNASARAQSQNVERTDLGVDVLEVCQSVLAVIRVLDVIVGDFLVTARRREDAVHELGRGSDVILTVFMIPVGRDLFGGITGREDLS